MKLTVDMVLQIPTLRAINCASIGTRKVRRVVTDSREARKGDVFVAFRGSRVDAHDYVAELCARGVLLCVVENRWYRKHASEVAGLPLLVVRDTMLAYGDIARLYRALYDVPVVAITGSNGKTSTKEMVAAVLGTKFAVLKNSGNLNNHLGLPATLLQLTDKHEIVVTEMGSNQPGDIGYLCSIARPDCGMITNIGRAHIERLRSRDGIAEEKRALFDALGSGGIALANADEPLLRGKLSRGVRRISFGTDRRSDVRITNVSLDARGRAVVRIEAPAFIKRPVILRLQAVGRHAAYNAAAALAAGFALDCGIRAMQKALEGVRNYDKRTEVRDARGITVINDTYNANPDSVLAALDLLQQLAVKGSRCIVLGDMLELGKVSAQEHEAIGAALAAAGIPYVLTFGRHSRSISRAVSGIARYTAHYTDKDSLCQALDVLLEEGDTVLVKGSRSMRMEEVVTHLFRRPTSEEAEA